MSEQSSDAQQPRLDDLLGLERLASALGADQWSRAGEVWLRSNEVVGRGFRTWLEYYPQHDAVQIRLDSSTTLMLEDACELRAALQDLLKVNADLRNALALATRKSA